MTGDDEGTRRHTHLAIELATSLNRAPHDRPRTVLGASRHMVMSRASCCTYPDVVVVCGPAPFTGAREETLPSPTLIVEGLSRSTARDDRGRKLGNDRTIASLSDDARVAPAV